MKAATSFVKIHAQPKDGANGEQSKPVKVGRGQHEHERIEVWAEVTPYFNLAQDKDLREKHPK